MRRIFIALMIIIGTVVFYKKYYADHNCLDNKVKASVAQYLQDHFMNGVYMFSDSDKTISEGAKGLYSMDTGTTLKESQAMPIASATKTFTAAGILKLQEKGLLNVQDSVAKYFNSNDEIWNGNFPEWANHVTLHHLLIHTSGVAEYFMNAKLDVNQSLNEINKDIVGFAASKELAFEPGSEYLYSNTNYVILGLVIEKITKQNIATFYNEEFFKPLNLYKTRLAGLQETIQGQTNPETSEYPVRYFVTPTNSDPDFNLAQVEFLMIPYSDGGIISTTADLIKWNKALHSGQVLSEESYKLMTEKHYPVTKNKYAGYGMYINILQNGCETYSHSGNAVGIRSESGYLPKHDLYFAIISNMTQYLPENMQGKIDLSQPENQLDIAYFLKYVLSAVIGD